MSWLLFVGLGAESDPLSGLPIQQSPFTIACQGRSWTHQFSVLMIWKMVTKAPAPCWLGKKLSKLERGPLVFRKRNLEPRNSSPSSAKINMKRSQTIISGQSERKEMLNVRMRAASLGMAFASLSMRRRRRPRSNDRMPTPPISE